MVGDIELTGLMPRRMQVMARCEMCGAKMVMDVKNRRELPDPPASIVDYRCPKCGHQERLIYND